MWAQNLRPASTLDTDGWGVTGAASAHAALAGNTDGAYVSSGLLGLNDPTSGRLELRLGNPTPPPGLETSSYRLLTIVRVRARWTVTGTVTSPPPDPVSQVQIDSSRGGWRVPVPSVEGQWSGWQYLAGSTVPVDGIYSLDVDLQAFVPGGWLTPGYSYEVQVSQLTGQVTASQQVTVALDSPPTSVSDTSRPTFSFSVVSGQDADLIVTAIDVRVYQVEGSWNVPGPDVVPWSHQRIIALGQTPTSWTSQVDLPNGIWGAVFTAEGWIGGSPIVSVITAASHHSWQQQATQPNQPGMSVTPRPELGLTELLLVSTTTNSRIRVQYQDQGGTNPNRWREMRRDMDAPAVIRDGAVLYERGTGPGGARTVRDQEAPIGVERTYRVTAYTFPNGLNGAPVASVPREAVGLLSAEGTWLHDALDPERYRAQLQVTARRLNLVARDEVMLPVGQNTAIVESQPLVPEWELDTYSLGAEAYWHLYEALNSGRVFVMRFRGHEHFVRMVGTRSVEQESWDGLHMDRQTLRLVAVDRPVDL